MPARIPPRTSPTTFINEQLDGIFISYRHDDSIESAGRIRSWLSVRANVSIFLDVDLPGGIRFQHAIDDTIRRAAVVIVVIGDKWLTISDAEGIRRLDHPDDLVRHEIEQALKYSKPIVPLLVHFASMPKKYELPPSIADLADFNAIRVRYDPDFDEDMRSVRQSLSKYFDRQVFVALSERVRYGFFHSFWRVVTRPFRKRNQIEFGVNVGTIPEDDK